MTAENHHMPMPVRGRFNADVELFMWRDAMDFGVDNGHKSTVDGPLERPAINTNNGDRNFSYKEFCQ